MEPQVLCLWSIQLIFDTMKRASILLLASFYFAISVGISLNLHYCGGKIAAVSVAFVAPSCCCGEKEEKKSCCSDQEIKLQMDTDQHFATAADLTQDLELFKPAITINETPWQIYPTSEISFQNYAQPPPLSSKSMRIRMHALTVYG